MDTLYTKNKNETINEYVDRMLEEKDFIGSWHEVAALINSQTGENRSAESYRKRAAKNKKNNLKTSSIALQAEQDALTYPSEHAALLKDLKTEKELLDQEKRVVRGWVREECRMDNFQNQILKTMKETLNPSKVKIKKIAPKKNKKEAILNIADIHFGKEFTLYDFEGNVQNEYSSEVCFKRLDNLLVETKNICEKERIKELNVFSLGDLIEGDLRPQTRYALKYTAPEQIVLIANYLAKWFEELSKYVRVIYHQTSGNHGDVRLDGSKDGQDPRNNLEPIAATIIANWNRNNPNFKHVENPTGFCYTTIAGYKVLGIHGEVKNLEKAILEYSNFYNSKIDYIMAGHAHNQNYKNTGEKSGYVGAGSIVGSDTYSKKIRKTSDANATMVIFEKEKGIVTTHTIPLN